MTRLDSTQPACPYAGCPLAATAPQADHGLIGWFFHRTPGTVRFRLVAGDWLRGITSGVTVTGVVVALQWVMAHLSYLPLSEQTALAVSAILGGLVAALQLFVRYFQHDPNPAPGPAPVPVPVPFPGPIPAPAADRIGLMMAQAGADPDGDVGLLDGLRADPAGPPPSPVFTEFAQRVLGRIAAEQQSALMGVDPSLLWILAKVVASIVLACAPATNPLLASAGEQRIRRVLLILRARPGGFLAHAARVRVASQMPAAWGEHRLDLADGVIAEGIAAADDPATWSRAFHG